MGGNYGYDEIRKVAFFGLAFGEAAIAASHATGPLRRAAAFLVCLDEAAALLSLDREKLAKEFGEFDAEDRANLLADCAGEFDIADDELEGRLEAGVAAGLKLLEGIEAAVAAWKGKVAT